MRRGLLLGVLLLWPATARGDVSCAGDGPPLTSSFGGYLPASLGAVSPTALLTLRGVPWAGDRARARDGDPVSDGDWPVHLERARLGVCGAAQGIGYRLVYEPWSASERARTDGSAWGRLTDASVAWAPYPWWIVRLGVARAPLGRMREQPVGGLALPALPYADGLVPDRRLGLSSEAQLGVLRLAAGAYLASRAIDIDRPEGALLVARLEVTPIGPVGPRAWPEVAGAPAWTPRPRPSAGLTVAYRFTPRGDGWLVGADLALAAGRWFVAGEVLYARRWPLERPTADPAALADRLGAWIEGLVRLGRLFHLAVRAEYLDEEVGREGTHRFVALTGGGGVDVAALVRLQALYARKLHLGPGGDDDVALLALTVQR